MALIVLHIHPVRWLAIATAAAFVAPFVRYTAVDASMAFACGWALSGLNFALCTAKAYRGDK